MMNGECNQRIKDTVRICEKYTLTVHEAAEYFSIGFKKMHSMAEDGVGRFSIRNGNRYLIIRKNLEECLSQCTDL